jgi:hypothetical protein
LQLAAILPTKTVPSRGGRINSDAQKLRKRKPKTKTGAPNAAAGPSAPPPAKRPRVTVENVPDKDDTPAASTLSHPSATPTTSGEQGNIMSSSRSTKCLNAKVCISVLLYNCLIYHLLQREPTNPIYLSIL